MNDAVHQSGVTSSTYRPGGFTLETSTGTLWWTRINDTWCTTGVTEISRAMRLSDLDENVYEKQQPDGTYNVNVECSPPKSLCMPDWSYEQCLPIDKWHWELGTNDYPDVVEVFDKTQRYWSGSANGSDSTKSVDPGPLIFRSTYYGLQIDMTNDQAGRSELITNLKELILAHSGKGSTTRPSYDETASWIQSKIPLLGHTATGVSFDYNSFSMAGCTLRFAFIKQYPSRTHTESFVIPLSTVGSVEWLTLNDGQNIVFDSLTESFAYNKDGVDSRVSRAWILTDRPDVDNSDLGPRIAKAFEYAVALCKATTPKSSEPF